MAPSGQTQSAWPRGLDRLVLEGGAGSNNLIIAATCLPSLLRSWPLPGAKLAGLDQLVIVTKAECN